MSQGAPLASELLCVHASELLCVRVLLTRACVAACVCAPDVRADTEACSGQIHQVHQIHSRKKLVRSALFFRHNL